MSASSLLSNSLVLYCALLVLILLLFGAVRRRRPLPLRSLALDAMLDCMGDGLIVVDRAGLIVEYNPAAARLAALDQAAAGQPLVEATGDRALGAVLNSMLAASAGPSERTINLQAAQPRRLQVILTPLADPSGGRRGTLLMLRELTEQMRAEEALARQSAGLAALHQVAAVAGSAQERPARLHTIAAAAREALGVRQVAIGLIDEVHEQLTIVAESNAGSGSGMVGMVIPLSGGTYRQAWQLDTPLAIADPQGDPRLACVRDALARHKVRALLIVPLRAGERLIGTLNFAADTPRELEPKELMLAQTLADFAAAIVCAQHPDGARQADRAKSAILDTVSHEFRTPITAILGFTELYQEGVLGSVTEEQHEALEAVHRNAHRLLKLVDDLLDLARLEAGKLDMALYPVEVGLCIKEATGLLATQFQHKQLGLRLEIADELPLAWADAMWLRRVLVNLLMNALDCTSAGEVTVRAYETTQPDDPPAEARRLVIEIKDTGRGIPAAEQQLIFDAFQRAANDQPVAPARSALGLTISKRVIDQMEGQLVLDSQLDHGSTFTITLHTAELALEHPHS